MGELVFPETDPISLFLGLLIYFLLHIGVNTESPGGDFYPDLYQNQVLYIKKDLRGLHHLLAMRPADIYDPFFLITKRLIFSKGVFS